MNNSMLINLEKMNKFKGRSHLPKLPGERIQIVGFIEDTLTWCAEWLKYL
jgi:hypothetical protein